MKNKYEWAKKEEEITENLRATELRRVSDNKGEENTALGIRRIIVSAFSFQIASTNCAVCGWPRGGSGNYKCLCVNKQ